MEPFYIFVILQLIIFKIKKPKTKKKKKENVQNNNIIRLT